MHSSKHALFLTAHWPVHHDASVCLVVEVRRAGDVVQRGRPAAAVVIHHARVGHKPHVHVAALHTGKKQNRVSCVNAAIALHSPLPFATLSSIK